MGLCAIVRGVFAGSVCSGMYVCVCVCSGMFVCVYVSMYVCVVYVVGCMFVRLYVCMHVFVRVCVGLCSCECDILADLYSCNIHITYIHTDLQIIVCI